MVFEVFDRLRKRTLGWLGAVLVVVVILGLAVFLLGIGHGGQPGFGAIRAYYRSAAGGSVPRAALARLAFGGCHDLYTTREGIVVHECTLREGTRTYTPCFAFDLNNENVIDAGTLRCDRLAYDRRNDRWVFHVLTYHG